MFNQQWRITAKNSGQPVPEQFSLKAVQSNLDIILGYQGRKADLHGIKAAPSHATDGMGRLDRSHGHFDNWHVIDSHKCSAISRVKVRLKQEPYALMEITTSPSSEVATENIGLLSAATTSGASSRLSDSSGVSSYTTSRVISSGLVGVGIYRKEVKEPLDFVNRGVFDGALGELGEPGVVAIRRNRVHLTRDFPPLSLAGGELFEDDLEHWLGHTHTLAELCLCVQAIHCLLN